MGLFKKSHKETEVLPSSTTSSTATDGGAYGSTTGAHIPGNEPYSSHAPGTDPTPGSYAATSGPTHHPTQHHGSHNADPRTTGEKIKDAFIPGDQGAKYRHEGETYPAGTTQGYGHGHGHTSTDPALASYGASHGASHGHNHTGTIDDRTTGEKVKDTFSGNNNSRERDYAHNPSSTTTTTGVPHDPYNQTSATSHTGTHHHNPAGGVGAGSGLTTGTTGTQHENHNTTSSSGGIFNRNKGDSDLESVLRKEEQAKRDMEEAIARHQAAHTDAGSRLQKQEEAARLEYEAAERKLREAEAFRKQHGY